MGKIGLTDMAWRAKNEIEKVSKEFGGSTDLLFEPYDAYRFGFKGRIGRAGIELMGSADPRKTGSCRIFVLSATNEELEKARTHDNWLVPDYEEKRQAKGEKFDIELPVTCDEKEFRRVVGYLKKFGLASIESC